MDRFVEYLWGWETTVPDLVSENTWNEVHEIYVEDKYQMGLKEFFDENNPWASQALAGRMLETARKDRWHPSQEVKQELIERYEQSVQDHGVTCCHHTCGNLALQEYMQGVIPVQDPDSSSSRESKSRRSKSSSSSTQPEPRSVKEMASSNQTQSTGFGSDVTRPEPSDSLEGEVKGFVMETVVKDSTQDSTQHSSEPSSSSAPLLGVGLVLVVLSTIWTGFRGRI